MSIHNGADDLRATVDSILSQVDSSFEFIIIDDGSNDGTDAILESMAQKHTAIVVVKQKNMGITLGLRNGCGRARGRYIARQDVGDYSKPTRLRTHAAALQAQPELSFVSCWTEVCGPEREHLSFAKGSGIAKRPTAIIDATSEYGVIDGPAHHGSVMFRRDAYLAAGGYRQQFYFGQDWDLWYRLAERGRFQMVEEVLYQACITPGSLSGRYRREQQAIAKLSHAALRRRLCQQPEDDVLEQASRIRPGALPGDPSRLRAQGLYAIGERLRRQGDPRAEHYFRAALDALPTLLKPRLRLTQMLLGRIAEVRRRPSRPAE